MNPTRVLEEQGLLRDRLSTPNYTAYMQPFMEDIARKASTAFVADADGRPSGWHFCQREQKRLEMAEAFFVSKDMCQVASWAAASLDETDTFRHDLWPTDYGFLWLDESLVGKEMWGRTVTTKAYSWGRSVVRGRPGTLVVLYTDMDDERDQVNTEIKRNAEAAGDWQKYRDMGNLHVHHVMWIEDGKKVGPAEITPPEDYQQYASVALINGEELVTQTLAEHVPNDARFLLALLMLFNQTVASVVVEEADKRTAKRMRRMNLPSAVTIIRLRRSEGSRKEGESEVEWQHRWLVRGHWRWQPYGKPDVSHTHVMGEVMSDRSRLFRLCETIGCTQHWERIYVAPFVKGPDGAPFRQSKKVYAMVR